MLTIEPPSQFIGNSEFRNTQYQALWRWFRHMQKQRMRINNMPNWISNMLQVIKGDPQEVFAFVRSDRSLFDFNKLIPMPEDIKNSDGRVTWEGFNGVPAWYGWAVKYRGTKLCAAGFVGLIQQAKNTSSSFSSSPKCPLQLSQLGAVHRWTSFGVVSGYQELGNT